jgi:hypothetical protein
MEKDNIFKKEFESLLDSGIFLKDLLPTTDATIHDASEVINIIENSYPLEYDSDTDELYYLDEKGERQKAPDLSDGISNSADWLSDKLPEPTFDFDQGGNLRKSEEAKSAYSLCCIAIALSSFREEIIEVMNQYDFNEMQFTNDNVNYVSLTSFLKSFQDLNSVRINTVISSAGIRISRSSEKKDAYWRISLSAEEISEYSKVSRAIKNVIIKYELEQSLAPNEIKKLTKVERLRTLEKRDLEIDRIIDNSAIPIIYRISKFNSERLPAVAKRKIYLSARAIANAAVLESGLSGYDANELFEKEFSKYTRDMSRMAVTTLRHNEIFKYKNDPSNYRLITKM